MRKETCIQCRDIICTDIKEGERAIGNLDGQAIRFPENVKDCPRKMDDEQWWDLYGKVDERNLGS